MIYASLGKRLFDFWVSTIGLAACMPLFGILAVLIKFTSPGPVFFRQDRMGKDGRLFQLIKFRSMSSRKRNPTKQFTPGELGRVTPLGRVLRKSKMDELPQLVNVLAGEMSLVGPRPEVPEYLQFYRGEWVRVLSVKPGLTDPASMKYRDEDALLSRSSDPESFYRQVVLPDKLQMNLAYAQDVRFAHDLKILWQTFRRLGLPRREMTDRR
jgi:lipopolysaccharide/colanic/teichoic acid biosynthesis glycosyltransferase